MNESRAAARGQASGWRLNLTVRGVRSASHRSIVRAVQDAGAAEGYCHAWHVDFPGYRSDVLRRDHAGVYDQPAYLFPRVPDGQQNAEPGPRRIQNLGDPGEPLYI